MRTPNVPRALAYALASLFAIVIAGDLLWMPIQVGDSLGEILDASRSPSIWASFAGSLGTDEYLRPLRIAQIKALFDLAPEERYWVAYRGFHALLLIAGVLLFTRALRVSTSTDFVAAAFALVVLTGLHTFRGNVQEAFPINHFLEIVVACLLTLNLAQSRGGLWVDAAAALTFIVAALTLESGLLVWVVAVAAWVVGWRGISNGGLVLMTAFLGAYFYLRFVYLSTGAPAVAERSSGFMFEILDRSELQQRFGANPFWFYTYNVASSFGSVLFSEPQNGVLVGVREWLAGAGRLPRVFVPVATSIATTALVAWTAWRAFRSWNDSGRLVAVFVAVLVANAAMSYAYTKDDIMSTAGTFYALAAFAAVRELLASAGRVRPPAAVAIALLLSVLTIGWSIRSAGLHYVLRLQATRHQADWVWLPGARQRAGQWPEDPSQQRLILDLRNDALELAVPNTRADVADGPRWVDRYWVE
jgi:hypothetical protein